MRDDETARPDAGRSEDYNQILWNTALEICSASRQLRQDARHVVALSRRTRLRAGLILGGWPQDAS